MDQSDTDLLDATVCVGDLAAFAVGRLAARFSFHLSQAILLSTNPIPEREDHSFEILCGATLRSHKCPDDLHGMLNTLKGKMARDAEQCRAEATLCVQQLTNFARQLPTAGAIRVADSLRESLIRLVGFDEADAFYLRQINLAYRQLEVSSGPEPDERWRHEEFKEGQRRRLCRESLDRLGLKKLTVSIEKLRTELDAPQQRLFTLGWILDQGGYPVAVGNHLIRQGAEAFLSDIAISARSEFDVLADGLVAYERRRPYELIPRPDWVQDLRSALEANGTSVAGVFALIRQLADAIAKRTLSSSQLREFTADIDAFVTNPGKPPATKDTTATAEWVSGRFGEVMEIDPSGSPAELRHAGKKVAITSRSQIAVVRLLIQAKGEVVGIAELKRTIGQGIRHHTRARLVSHENNDIHLVTSKLQKKCSAVGLTVKSTRGRGYSLGRLLT